MRYGIDVCTLGEFAEPARVVELAQAAEAAGWEAVFVWDHLAFAWGVPSADPWVILAAVAQATTRVRIGTAVTPLPRRRPAVVANAVATLDRLSGGRMVLGAGAGGVPAEFTAFGEPGEPRVRATMLDEALDVVSALWTGQPVSHAGEHYSVDGVTLAPLPLQRPRPPIWIGGHGKAARRRARRWDGWIVGGDNEAGEMAVPPERLAAGIVHIGRDAPFDVALTGVSAGPDDAVFGRYEAAGVTWWLEHIHGRRAPHADLLSRVEAGPPR
ncbi:LLM class flavin-dependent oxidoreductase [Micromonospora sp. CPCC 206061]|uniref:LLM class flavin-dependent oxidoreductase n=1 Tax=Micromonospora sp. CPCC 206061 TaxID=3122410 RepID=UPI002FF1CECD